MELYVLMGQRECDYEGQYAPEALACSAGPEHDDNPEYLEDAEADHTMSGEFQAVTIITLEFSTEELERRLFPEREPIKAEVK